MPRAFASRVEVVSSSNTHVRYVPAAVARSLVEGGSASIANQNGKIRSVRLIASAGSHATRIGEPEGTALFGTKFVRRERLDDVGAVVWTHHPRATYPEPE